MIDTIAKRRFTLNGKAYAKGDTVPMPVAQFDADHGPNGTGLVERAPKAKATPIKSDTKAD